MRLALFSLVSTLCWLAVSATEVSAAGRQAVPQDPPPPKEIQPGESRLQFYGQVRQDLIFDDSRPDAFQTPLFILSEPDGAQNLANFTMHPRLTRFGINASGPALEPLRGARVTGKFEFDFQNGGRESRAIPRFRHMYLQLTWSAASLLIGQTSDIISPLFPAVNGDTLMWNAGNLGDRRPQVRLAIQPPSDRLRWSITAGAGLPGAVDAQDLDGDGVRDGEAAAVPNGQARFGLSYPLQGPRRLTVGFWGHLARQRVSSPIASRTDFGSHSIGLDYEIPIGGRGVFRGEAWTGRNLSDLRGGAGQAINRTTGEGIASKGGWVEIGGDVTAHYAIFGGYTIDSPEEDDLPSGGRKRNGAWFIVNRWNTGPFVFGIDYLYWTTDYKGSPRGTNNRANAYFIYNF